MSIIQYLSCRQTRQQIKIFIHKEQIRSNVKPNATLGERAFLFAAPKLWNAVPRFIRESISIDTFKRKLKTYLFKKSILYHLDYKIVFLAY